MLELLLISAGGAVGAVLRFALSTLINSRKQPLIPLGTAAVNILGCFVVGALCYQLTYGLMSTSVFILFNSGVLGGFTTFSTACVETANLVKARAAVAAVAHGLGMLLLSTLSMLAGMELMHLLVWPLT